MSYQSLYTAAQVRELDRIVIEKFDISGYELMQRAGSFTYSVLNKYFPRAFYIYVFCGRGNNAGDGYVLAKLAIEDDKYDREVIVVNCFNPKKLEGDAKTAYQDLVTMKYDKNKVEIRDGSTFRKEEYMDLNLGELGKKTVFAGIKKSYQSKDLIGRKLVCVANLKPREMRFGTSEGMILACGEDESGIFLLSPDSGALAGMQVT